MNKEEITAEDFERARKALEKHSVSPEQYFNSLSDKDKKRIFGYIKRTEAWKDFKKLLTPKDK